MLGVFLDTETNGLNPEIHRLLEVAFQIVDLVTGEVKESFEAVVAQPIEAWEKSCSKSLKINGFTWEEISQGLPEALVTQQIIESFARWGIRRKKAVFVCQNPSFDRIFFSQLIDTKTQEACEWPYHWLDLASMHWAISMDRARRDGEPFPWDIGYSKDLIASHYRLPREAMPHRAMNGVAHLLLCYQAVVGFPRMS